MFIIQTTNIISCQTTSCMYISITYVWVNMSALISQHQTITADE